MNVPSTTVEFLDALKAKRGWTSDYQLWKALGWKQTTVSSYRNGRAAIAGRHAVQIAEELGLPHAYVLACGNLEREKDPAVSKAWRAVADHFRSAAAIILIALAALAGGRDAHAAPVFSAVASESNSLSPVYIMRSTWWRRPAGRRRVFTTPVAQWPVG